MNPTETDSVSVKCFRYGKLYNSFASQYVDQISLINLRLSFPSQSSTSFSSLVCDIYYMQGIIPAENLKKILMQLPDTSEEEVDAMISAIDDDGNGEVDFNGKILLQRNYISSTGVSL